MRLFLVIAGLCVAPCLLSAQTQMPQFQEYPAKETYKGSNAPLILTQNDRGYRTRLRFAATQKPNFAKHYILTAWGCGAECLAGAVIDANTGRVYWFPHTICCWFRDDDDDKVEPIDFRLDSTLVVFSGTRNMQDNDHGAHYYKFERGQFVHIRSIRKPMKKQ